MKRIARIMTLILVLGFSCMKAESRDTSMLRDLTHSISAEIRPTYNMPTHGFYKGLSEHGSKTPFCGSIHLKYGFRLSQDNSMGSLFPSVYQGIGLSAYSFLKHDQIGSPAAIYLYQGAELLKISDKMSWGYEWNLGYSFGWHPNVVVSSKWNVYINVGLPLRWRISPAYDLTFGPEYTHFSNGDTSFPNGGANTVGCRLGFERRFGRNAGNNDCIKLFSTDASLAGMRFAERISYDITVFGAWRADRFIEGHKIYIMNKAHPIAGFNFNPLYRFNRYLSAGASLDMIMDRSADLHDPVIDKETDQVISISSPSALKQTACGISIRGELTMPFFSINIGGGYNILSGCNDLKCCYMTYNLKGFVTENIFLNIGYRLSSVLYSHNMMFGIGFRL